MFTVLKSLEDFKALAQRIAQQLPPRSRVLEIATGRGHFAIELAKLGDYRITGLDASETFVEIARANAAEADVRVDFRQGNASAMRLPASRFDFILCRAAFKNVSHPAEALEEMHRVLKPGGRALIIDLRRDASRQAVRQAVDAMNLGAVNRIITKLSFRFMLLKRANSKAEFEELLSRSKFAGVEIVETPTSVEILVTKGGSTPIPPFGSLAAAPSLCYTSE